MKLVFDEFDYLACFRGNRSARDSISRAEGVPYAPAKRLQDPRAFVVDEEELQAVYTPDSAVYRTVHTACVPTVV